MSFKYSRDTDSTSLGSLFQCLTTLSVRKLFLISSVNLPWCNLGSFALLLLGRRDKPSPCYSLFSGGCRVREGHWALGLVEPQRPMEMRFEKQCSKMTVALVAVWTPGVPARLIQKLLVGMEQNSFGFQASHNQSYILLAVCNHSGLFIFGMWWLMLSSTFSTKFSRCFHLAGDGAPWE